MFILLNGWATETYCLPKFLGKVKDVKLPKNSLSRMNQILRRKIKIALRIFFFSVVTVHQGLILINFELLFYFNVSEII